LNLVQNSNSAHAILQSKFVEKSKKKNNWISALFYTRLAMFDQLLLVDCPLRDCHVASLSLSREGVMCGGCLVCGHVLVGQFN